MGKQYYLNRIDLKSQTLIEKYQLNKNQPYTVGRSDQADITIAKSSSLSRKHIKLTITGKQIMLEDLGSANGTFVNSKRLESKQQVELQKSDIIYLGELQEKLTISKEKQNKQKDQDEDEQQKENIEQEQQQMKETKQNGKKQKKFQNQMIIKSESEESESESDNEEEQKKSKQKLNKINNKKEKSSSRSRSRSQEKNEQKTQTILASNKQFGKEKADLQSKFGGKANNINQKRSLLWGNKDKKEIPKEKQIWNSLSNVDKDNKLKFMKLLGVKDAETLATQEEKKDKPFVIKSAANVKVDKNQQINDNLEKQYMQGISRKFLGKGGLGK
ncbi:SMAD/FHA domain [Pseudocohnilembus persalinus]|uniref:SMAD/FHA domain n=1 Tax=Pseudocohnilembus persalinus TaxID=266149 RepID=A0A0V0QGP8_PSEPJ|nr:SMAD/FHA domain [Pseudocohnilembus persalinus]|eukprot:KRX01306.1 SMAD/FHA domain [Pseudocohnilembus persalinus]